MEESKDPQIPSAEWAAKFKGKREQFNFLTVEVRAYLSDYETVTTYFMKDLIAGKKKCKCQPSITSFVFSRADIRCDSVKVLFAPQYESLSISEVLKKARDWELVWQYLPDERDLHRLPRSWLVNLIFSVVGGPFRDWVDARVEERNAKHVDDNNKMIAVDPEVLAAFRSSTHISSK